MTESQEINKAPQYQNGDIETIVMIDSITKSWSHNATNAFYAASILKYLDRAPHKGTMLKDLKKAEYYLRRLINKIESEDSNTETPRTME